ncbi:putative reverse transcriptase domain-containing protein [Tanacetum coccineum]
MQEELLQFKLQKVWTLVDLPNCKRPIGTKWVSRNKKDERGIVVRNKARLVATRWMCKKCLLYGIFKGMVYFCQPSGLIDPHFLDKAYKEISKHSRSCQLTDSAVTYTFVHSEARSWSIPSKDPYEEAVRQLLEQAPRSPEYVPNPIELEDHVPMYIPKPEHPEDLVPAEDEAPTPPLPPFFLSPRIRSPCTRAVMAQMRATALSTYHSLLPSGTPPLLHYHVQVQPSNILSNVPFSLIGRCEHIL